MPNIGPLEIVMVAVVALVVFGPHRLPEIARTVGRALNEVRRMASDVRSEFDSGFGLEDDDEDFVDDDDEPTADGIAESAPARAGGTAPVRPRGASARSTADGIAAAGRAAARRGPEPAPASDHDVDMAMPEPSPSDVVTADGIAAADVPDDAGPDDGGPDAPAR
ncbi:MAG TPA: Sec-independent protein translocase protein TatB [Actinomycetota bacterium]|nr:Sec-independent protein translocase protein TatB [Actinomycetota bacterium]